MRALIIPSKDRPATIMLTILYNRLGFDVVYPTRDSWPDDIDNICLWPVYLMKNASTGNRVIEDLPLNITFGEDNFLASLSRDQIDRTGHPDARVFVEDIRETGSTIDLFHTTRENIGKLPAVMKRALSLMPRAKWVSSTISDYDHNPFGLSPKNVCKILPASYDRVEYSNSFDLLGMKALGEFLGANDSEERSGFASFNHNYSARQPLEFKTFEDVNIARRESSLSVIPNYGGNTRGQGADVRYSGDGSTGKFRTLSPIEAAHETSRLLAAVHLKSNDWGGGVPLLCMSLGTPIIVTRPYAERTLLGRAFRHMHNSVWVESSAEYKCSLEEPPEFWNDLSNNVIKERDSYDDETREKWATFVERSLA